MNIIVRELGLQDYLPCWHAMQTFTNTRDEKTFDEIWLLEHPSVFTQGQNGKPEHILFPGNIPVIPTDRGGQITYHGPGQCIIYTLIDLKRKKINIREFITLLENTVIDYLSLHKMSAHTKSKAPGVYVNEKKICSLGLRVRRGATYHGLALNVEMDLEPFSRIHPCGFSELVMTQVSEYTDPLNFAGRNLVHSLITRLGYTDVHFERDFI